MESTLTALIEAAENGDGSATEALFTALYAELHRLAKQTLARRGGGVSLSVITLLHEAYLDMAERAGTQFPDRARFMGYAAHVMRGLIIDHARNRQAQKRGFLTFSNQTLSGVCCFSWGDTIKVTEPAKVTPVVVTWSAEYFTGGIFYAGLSINGGACTAYGPRTLENFAHASDLRTQSFQWVIKPTDGLVPGTNTFTLCGGADPSTPNNALILGIRTLAAEVGK